GAAEFRLPELPHNTLKVVFHHNLHSSFDPIPLCISLYPGEDIEKEQPSPCLSCPKGSLLFYCFPPMQLACQKWSEGHLVSVLSGAEASFLTSLVKSSVNSYQYVWIGLHDPTLGQEPNGAGWEWSSTDVLNYTNWERNPSTASDRGYCGSVFPISPQPFWTLLPYIHCIIARPM
uniref:C-type lectin domain-containing protein n=1 Tax=Marmota marmota marmota TaxID=9994 RepID=A0A8C6EPH7_MARMA